MGLLLLKCSRTLSIFSNESFYDTLQPWFDTSILGKKANMQKVNKQTKTLPIWNFGVQYRYMGVLPVR